MTEINDLQVWIKDDFWEFSRIRGSDFINIEDGDCLWQAVEGELKTKKGDCRGVGLETYGTSLYQILGQNIDDLVIKEMERCVNEVASKYPQIQSMTIMEVTVYKNGDIRMIITIQSTFGQITKPFSLCQGV